jgi:hypothetical protein
MPKELVPPIKARGVGPQESSHARDPIGPGRFHDQMKVMVHQAIGMDLPVCLFHTSAPTSPGTTGDQSHLEKLTPDGPLDSSHDKLRLDIPLAVCAASRAIGQSRQIHQWSSLTPFTDSF